MQRTTQVVVSIQLRGKSQHCVTVATCQRGVDIGNYFGSRERIVHIWAGRIEQCRNSGSEQNPRRGCSTGAALEVQCLKQCLVIQPKTIWYIKDAFESLVGRETRRYPRTQVLGLFPITRRAALERDRSGSGCVGRGICGRSEERRVGK